MRTQTTLERSLARSVRSRAGALVRRWCNPHHQIRWCPHLPSRPLDRSMISAPRRTTRIEPSLKRTLNPLVEGSSPSWPTLPASAGSFFCSGLGARGRRGGGPAARVHRCHFGTGLPLASPSWPTRPASAGFLDLELLSRRGRACCVAASASRPPTSATSSRPWCGAGRKRESGNSRRPESRAPFVRRTPRRLCKARKSPEGR